MGVAEFVRVRIAVGEFAGDAPTLLDVVVVFVTREDALYVPDEVPVFV